ncbi:MAG: hypothetical protein HQ483_18315 [Rhodospirillales bacterium]|nr:hypothetical protein [Rhodospirillales bacterium]
MPTIDLGYTPRPAFRPFHMRTENRACLVCHRRAGKTVALIADMVDNALRCPKPNGRFQLLAPLHKQVKDIAWTYLKDMTAAILTRTVNESELWVALPSRAGTPVRVRLYGTDVNPDALRGLYSDGMALDEYADMNPAIWDSVVLPALADRGGYLVVSGTPRGYNAFYKRYQESLRDERWYSLLLKASQSAVLSADTLVDLAREMPPGKYAQEMECDFTQAATAQFVPTELVEKAMVRLGQADARMPRVLGVDVARFGDDASVLVTRRGRVVEALQRFTKRDLVTLANEVMKWADSVRPQMIYVDGAGVGGGVVDYLSGAGYPVRDVQVGGRADDRVRYLNKRAELWGEMREWLATAQFQLPDDEMNILCADLLGPAYSYTMSGQTALERKQDMKNRGLASPDAGDALALTFFERLAPRGLRSADMAEDAEAMEDVW